MINKEREQWSSSLGFILASIGGAVGLGAVWKFPYTVGQYGGSAFLIVFLIVLMLIATPLLMIEFAIGRKTKLNYQGALKLLFPGKKWYLIGMIGLIVLITVLSFYLGVSGWTIAYLFKSLFGTYAGDAPTEVANSFGSFLNSPFEVLFWLLVMTVLTGLVVLKGVQKGIEKVCKILIPLLLIMIVILSIKAISLPGAALGLEFYLKPDFSAISFESILAAIGLAFFTLGVGAGNLVIYGSYLDNKRTIGSSTFIIVLGDALVAILMGFIIFPAVFAFGIEPTAGPPLVFITLPIIFAQMKFGMLFAVIFYLLLIFACLTSTIAILEAIVGYFVDEWKWSRRKTVVISLTGIYILGVFQMLSFGPLSHLTLFNMTIFEFSDYLVTNILLPGGGLALLIFAGWMWKPKMLLDEINIGEGFKINKYYKITVRYLAPIALAIVYLQLLGII
ncbi:sodium-dependent transporter [Psychrobacillus sp. FSL H8-0484]|uniref:sodium-dependent transporter n=1 Tax=Psychrobacillus sp. FSL H8-0484 TaxID=2921390 RepID=UPI0030FCEB42